MMNDPAFRRAIGFTMADHIEGGYSDDPTDPGNWSGGKQGEGELRGTKYGISAAAYPTIDVKGLRKADAEAIYFRDYWVPGRCGDLPPRIAVAHFDACVNQGLDAAARALQRALNVTVDGVVGPITIAAARSRDQSELLPILLSERAWQYSGTKHFQRFGRGWMRRLFYLSLELSR